MACINSESEFSLIGQLTITASADHDLRPRTQHVIDRSTIDEDALQVNHGWRAYLFDLMNVTGCIIMIELYPTAALTILTQSQGQTR